MIECPYCPDERTCKNDLLFHVIKDHDADMSEWPTPTERNITQSMREVEL